MLIYVAGPYAGDTARNIEQAAQIAAELWALGHAVICPHTNTANFEKRVNVNFEQWIAGDLNMIARCDAVVLTPDWAGSPGVLIEKNYAEALGIPVHVAPDYPTLHAAEMCCKDAVRQAREDAGRFYRQQLAQLAANSAKGPTG